MKKMLLVQLEKSTYFKMMEAFKFETRVKHKYMK